jgi:hypothetical protein
MAEIEVRRQRPPPRWPWIVAALLALLVIISIWQALYESDDPAEPARVQPAPEGVGAEPPVRQEAGARAEDAFVDFARREGRQEPAHPTTIERGLELLAAVVGADDALRAAADSLAMGDWRTPRQTVLVQRALERAAERLQERGGGAAAAEAAGLARRLEASQLVTGQAGVMLAYWDAVRRGVEAMVAPAG